VPDPAADTALLLEAAEAAGEIALRHFRNSPAIYDKPGEGPVSEADLEIDEMLRARLGDARPDYGWLSEESPDDPARLDARRTFIVDPIDGTRSFIAGEVGFSVALAVVEDMAVTSAVVHLPAREETFSATRGGGAAKDGRPVAASRADDPARATVLTARRQLSDEHWPCGAPPLERHFRPSLAWRMCLVAEGRFDSMLTFRRAYEWDVAAGALIAAEAGARVTDGRGRPLEFNSPDGLQDGVIAAPAGLHRRIMARRLAPEGPLATGADRV